MKTNREKAIEHVNAMDIDELNDMVVRTHGALTHQWVEVYPNGTVHETEEPDNNTSHWIDYPNKAVCNIYDIRRESAQSCNCDICTMYDDFDNMDKDEFIERYSKEEWEYCNVVSFDDAILEAERDNDGLTAEDIREQMISAIEKIEHGYFDDEERQQQKFWNELKH